MEKATYSLSALKQCKELIRKNRWSTRLKAEHNSRCAEVNVLFASCQKLLNYVMFQPDLSPAYDYQQMVLSKNCTKKQLESVINLFIDLQTANKPTADHSMAIHRRLDSFSLIFYLLLILWVKTELHQSLPLITSGFQLLRSLSANKYFC